MKRSRTVSVIVTARNATPYLSDCLASICASDHQDLQIIAINDGSTDQTGTILDDFATRDSRIQTLHTPPKGRRASLQTAHNLATGETHCWVDADDLVHPSAISACLNKIDQEHQLVYTYRNLINPDGTIRGPHAKNKIRYRPTKLLVDNMIFHLRMFTAELLHEAGGIGELESAIDWDMNLRMTEHTTPKCIPRTLYSYRIHPNRMSGRPEQHQAGQTAVRQAIQRRNLNLELVINQQGWHLKQPNPKPNPLHLP